MPENILSQISVAGIFSDEMVLQQNAEVPVWGWANAGDTVTVTGSWNNIPVTTVTDSDRKWITKLSSPAAKTDGTSYTITITGPGNETLTLSEVLIGEVWLLSGQSNMEMPLSGWGETMPIEGGEEAIRTADLPEIRLFKVARKSAAEPQADLQNDDRSLWTKCTPESASAFSAVGFFFGRELHDSLKIPIGLVASVWGGSSCQAWTKKGSLDFVADYAGGGPWVPENPDDNNTPTVLFNGMIAPLVPFNFAGVCWYQGESNIWSAEQISDLFPAMIEGWREEFGKPALPFHFVQLAPYGGYADGKLPEFWEAQANTLNLHNTEMAETLDVGESDNIHPAKKEPIGHRLAQKAFAKVYGYSTIEFAGPRYKSHTVEGDRIRVSFTHTGSGLYAKDGTLTQFEAAGSDGVFYPADAWIEGDEVVVRSSYVTAPVNVRYAWDKNATGSLFNNEGFPAPSFRTNPASYINPVSSEMLIDTELIKEGEAVGVKWTTMGSDTVWLNDQPVNSSGTETLFPDTTTTYTLKVKNGDSYLQQSKTVYVIPAELYGWSKNKITGASSFLKDREPEFAVDENEETYWNSYNSNDEWIYVDLGEPVPVKLVILKWGNGYAQAYEIQVSDDAQNWTTIFKETAGDGGLDFIPGLNGSGRYVRFLGISRLGGNGYSLKEFEIYSTEKRKTGTLKDRNGRVLRGTPVMIAKELARQTELAVDPDTWVTLKNNGFNTVKVCWDDPWFRDRGKDHMTVAEVLPYFDNCVQNAVNTGMNIIINYHNEGAQENYDTDYSFELEKEFWDSIAPRYKDNDLVFYEPVSAPVHGYDGYTDTGFMKKLTELYRSVRQAAPQREILMFSYPVITDEIIDIVELYKDSIDWDKTAVAYHMYNSPTSDNICTLMAYHRSICTQWDYFHTGMEEGNDSIMQVDGFKENSQALENINSSWIDNRARTDTTFNELLDTLIFDAIVKDYWWGIPVEDLRVEGIKILQDSVTLKYEEKTQLMAKLSPALAGNQNITWSSSNSDLVTVDEQGRVMSVATQNGTAYVTATTADGGYTATTVVTALRPEVKEAYPDGIPHPVPGSIIATYYDMGGEGIGYHDYDDVNSGDGIRQDQSVDTEYRLEEGSIGVIHSDEWLEYTINVEEDTEYDIKILFATTSRYGKFHIEIDGEDRSGTVYVVATGSFDIFKPTVISNIRMSKGVHVLRIFFDFAYYNMGTITIVKSGTTAVENTGAAESVKLFPNPASNRLHISAPVLFDSYSVRSITGQTVLQGNLTDGQVIDISSLIKGNYILVLRNKDHIISKKLVKF